MKKKWIEKYRADDTNVVGWLFRYNICMTSWDGWRHEAHGWRHSPVCWLFSSTNERPPPAGIVKGGGEEGKIGKDEGENKDEEDGQVREAKKEEEEDEKGMEKRRETKKEQKDGEDTQSYFCTFFARSCRPNFYTSDPV